LLGYPFDIFNGNDEQCHLKHGTPNSQSFVKSKPFPNASVLGICSIILFGAAF